MYLHTLGVDISWAAFRFVELMSQRPLRAKRLAFLAAQQSFGPTTDVSLLTAHLLRKFIPKLSHPAKGLIFLRAEAPFGPAPAAGGPGALDWLRRAADGATPAEAELLAFAEKHFV